MNMALIPDLSDAELYAAEACLDAGNTDPALVAMVAKAQAVRETIERYEADTEGF